MIKKLLSLTAIVIALILSYGCNDDPSKPAVKSEPKFKFFVGSYWVYDHYNLNEDNSRDIDSKYSDSVVISGTGVLFGRTATIFKIFIEDNSTEKYYSVDSNKLYATTDFVKPDLKIPIELNIPVDTWFLIADYDQTQWNLYTQAINDVEVEFTGIKAKINGTFTISCKKVPNQTVNWGKDDSQSLVATDFQLIYNFTGTATVPFVGSPALNFEIVQHLYHSPEIGIIKIKRESVKIMVLSLELDPIKGIEQVMTTYKINK